MLNCCVVIWRPAKNRKRVFLLRSSPGGRRAVTEQEAKLKELRAISCQSGAEIHCTHSWWNSEVRMRTLPTGRLCTFFSDLVFFFHSFISVHIEHNPATSRRTRTHRLSFTSECESLCWSEAVNKKH